MNQRSEETEEVDEVDEADLEVDESDDSSDSDDIEFEEDEDYDLGKVESNEPEATRAIVFALTQTQYEVVIMAIQHIKDQFDYPIGDGKAIEILAIEFLNSPKGTTGLE